MDSKFDFKELMKQRHSARYFLSKPIPEETLKEVMSTSLLTPSWGNSQPWNIYVASGKTVEEIRKEWIAKNKEGAKGYSDIYAGHRTDFSERCQDNMNKIMKKFTDELKDPNCKPLWDANIILFNAPTVVYILSLNKGLSIIYLILVHWKCQLCLLLKKRELILLLLMKQLNIQIL